MSASLLKVIANQLQTLGDSNPEGNAKDFLKLLNAMYGKTRYTKQQFEEAYDRFSADTIENVDLSITDINAICCFKKPVMINGIKVERRDLDAEYWKAIEHEL